VNYYAKTKYNSTKKVESYSQWWSKQWCSW
jgi:hypothetical protein